VIPLRLATAGVALSAAFGAGWWVNGWRHDAAELQRQQHAAQEARRAAAQMDRAAEAYEARREAADAREAALDRRTADELKKPASRSPCLSPDGLRILSDAAAGSNAARGLAPAVSAGTGAN
jgi:hypothetical protein